MQEKICQKTQDYKTKMCKRKGGTYQKDEVVMKSLMLKTALSDHQIYFAKCHANPVRILGIFINKFGFLFYFVLFGFLFCFVLFLLVHVTLSRRAQLLDFSVLLPPSEAAVGPGISLNKISLVTTVSRCHLYPQTSVLLHSVLSLLVGYLGEGFSLPLQFYDNTIPLVQGQEVPGWMRHAGYHSHTPESFGM